MAPASENLFERLSDDLVTKILDRRLWCPLDWDANKAQERVRLELVCKRFQHLVRTSRSFEWDFTLAPESQAVFLSYVLPSLADLRHLERVALYLKADESFLTFLLLLIPQALGTLKEVHLFLEDESEHYEELYVDWDIVFRLLQACVHLTILDINLWDSWVRTPSKTLTFAKPLQSFPSLHVLYLYGFAVPSTGFEQFIQSFPSLQSLELHRADSELKAAMPSSIKKVFFWGAGIAGLDLENPERAQVPESLEMLLRIVRSKCARLKECALYKLDHLFERDVANRKAFVNMPGSLQLLVDLLEPEQPFSDSTVTALLLEKLSSEPAVYQTLGRVPEHLERLVSSMIQIGESGDEESCGKLARVLQAVLYCEGVNQGLLASLPGCVQNLVAFALRQTASVYVSEIADVSFEVLASLAATSEDGRQEALATESLETLLERLRLANVPGLFEGLVDALDDNSVRVQREAVRVLVDLAESSVTDGGNDLRAIAAVPGCLEKLVELLGSEDLDAQLNAAQALRNLAIDDGLAKAIAEVPECLQTLFDLLQDEATDCEEVDVQRAAAWALYNLACDAGTRKAVAGVDGAVECLASLLDDAYQDLVEPAVALLGQLASDPEGRRSIVSVSPPCLGVLHELLSSEAATVREHAAWVFHGLAEDGELRESVARLPGIFEKLAGLLTSGSTDLAKEAVKALRNLSAGVVGRRAIAAEAGAVQKLDSLSKAGELEEVRAAAAEILRNLAGGPSVEESAARGAHGEGSGTVGLDFRGFAVEQSEIQERGVRGGGRLEEEDGRGRASADSRTKWRRSARRAPRQQLAGNRVRGTRTLTVSRTYGAQSAAFSTPMCRTAHLRSGREVRAQKAKRRDIDVALKHTLLVSALSRAACLQRL
ncbi:hypothetical protein KFL_002770130 [Klebsormidium nitens]|uniref:Vacuolar protein 8 n=1 Tax=Klebsormidium nitens TaxID=105231 RepID=A0A1Y1IC01_KLENI|nr:hypothetical protein KFL_002770130 [Klebsormidium nitens]|eukprot:GAQ86236.1 hypothetical protein KFL_002770130 [Klebsormidium nitens]